MFWFLGHEACGILAPRPGIKPTPPALEGSLNHGTTREVLNLINIYQVVFSDRNVLQDKYCGIMIPIIVKLKSKYYSKVVYCLNICLLRL